MTTPGAAELPEAKLIRDWCEKCHMPLPSDDECARLVKALSAAQAGVPAGQHPDDTAVDRFAAAMKEKLAQARAKGRGGWDGPECNQERLSRMLREHVSKGDPRDVANFCMFLWCRGEAIAPKPVDPWREHLAEQAERIDCEALHRAMVRHGISTPEGGMEHFRAALGQMVNLFVLHAAPQPNPSPAPADPQPGDNNVQLDTDPNPTAPRQQRDVAGALALGQPVGDGQHETGRHTQAQGDKLLAVAERNLRRFLETAVFRDEADRQAALNCLEVMTTSAPAQPGREGERCADCGGKGVDGDVDDYGRTIDIPCGACNGAGRTTSRYRDRCTLGGRCLGGCLSSEPCYLAVRAAPQPATADAVDALPDEKTCVDYVLQYGGRCRDCADENGICPGSGLPCCGQRKAVTHVVQALRYGLQHGYLRAAQREVKP